MNIRRWFLFITVTTLFAAHLVVNGITPVETVKPEYPRDLQKEGVEGRAVVLVSIEPDGNVEDCIVVEATDPAFGEAALDAARNWKFEPFEASLGVRKIRIPFEFKLSFEQQINTRMGREVYRDLNPQFPIIDPEVFSSDIRPRPTVMAEPRYPEKLIGTGEKGSVDVLYYVDENGKAINPSILKATHDEFVMPALFAAMMTEWRPLYTSRNQPSYLKIKHTYEFYEGMDDEEKVEEPEKKSRRSGWFGRKKSEE